LSAATASPTEASRRLDQWLWFARIAKSRSLAARLCADGAVAVNGGSAAKAKQAVRIGDTIAVAHGPFRRRLRVLTLGVRRGPPVEAGRMYEEIEPPVRLSQVDPDWVSLLDDGIPVLGADA
jgi:ribosome-associated heat shock protein Hsp15